MSEVQSFLKSISFKDLENWSVSHLLKDTLRFNQKYQVVKLKEILSQADIEWVNIEDDKKYPILGVHSQGQGVYINRVAIGNELTMRKYQKSKAFHLFYCKVRTVKGQWGVVYPKYENSYASSNMQYLKINLSKIIPEFLENLLKIKRLTDLWDQNAIGADGRHFNKNILLNLEIPLPSLRQQEEILKKYNDKIELAKQQEQEAKKIEESIEEYLFEELGIEKVEVKKEKSGLQFVEFKDIDRWDIEYNSKLSYISKKLNGKYSLYKLGDLIKSYQYGLSEKASIENIGIPMLRMNNIFNGELIVDNLKYIQKTSKVEDFILDYNDLLFNRTNSKELVGKTAIFDKSEKYTFASYLIRVKINFEKANIKYINYLFNSSLLQFQKDLVSRQTSGQANINAQEMKMFLFPLPPLNAQEKIANEITKRKEKIKQLKQETQKNREEAIKEFEKEIFDEN